MTARTFSVETVTATDVRAAVATTNAWVLGSKITCRRLRTAARLLSSRVRLVPRYPST
jgi:hypothetical protein